MSSCFVTGARVGVHPWVLPLLCGAASGCVEDPGLGVVRAVCVNTIAVILKRGWLDMAQAQRDQFFHVRALQQPWRKMGL